MKRATQNKIKSDSEEIYDHFTLYTKPMLDKITKEGWRPECKQDVVDLLMEVQMGNVSCRRATSILFPTLD